MRPRLLLCLLAFALPVLAAGAVPDFAFVQISDTHVDAHLARTPPPGPMRGAECLAWVCEQASQPQVVSKWVLTTPAPAFVIATGDLTEFGVIDDTWAIFEQAFKSLPCPLYVLPGNHDNTWVAMYDTLRKRHGGENYSFDHAGCHFVCLCSASPQEPVPTLDGKTRAWLKRDLDAVPPNTPVFVALHHPPDGDEFANPAEYDTFVDLLRNYNVVLLLYGHGHSISHKNMDGLDGVMGGSTFGDKAGYNLVSVQDGALRVAYRYHKPPPKGDQPARGPAWRTVFQKPLPAAAPPRLFRIAAPTSRAGDPEVGPQFDLRLDLAAPLTAEALREVAVRIDGREVETERLTGQPGAAWRIKTGELAAGRHLLSVRVKTADDRADLRAITIVVGADVAAPVWRREFPAGIKAGPAVAGDRLVVARTDGVVTALDRHTGRDVWTFASGGEILGTPAWTSDHVVFGSGDGQVYAVDAGGRPAWTYDAGGPVYGVPATDADTVYIGDNGGRLHALQLRDGRPRWTFVRADYAIESQPCIWGDLVVFGAWDGHLYAVRRANGELAWKVRGPKASDGKGVRYYAPADCGPVAVGDTLFVCDRGYLLGTFTRAGQPGATLDKSVAAIAPCSAAGGILARATDDRVCRLDAAGEKLWERAVPAGRFPVPPTAAGAAVYVCSNRGLLSVLDAADGRVRWSYQVTPGFFVMAPVAVADDGACYVAGMDGSVTALRPGE